jgi:hypothetical protein
MIDNVFYSFILDLYFDRFLVIELLKMILLKLMVPRDLQQLSEIVLIIDLVGNCRDNILYSSNIPANPNLLNLTNIK